MDSYMEQNMVAELRDICNRFSNDEFQVTVFQPFFIFIDQVGKSSFIGKAIVYVNHM